MTLLVIISNSSDHSQWEGENSPNGSEYYLQCEPDNSEGEQNEPEEAQKEKQEYG